MSTIPPSIQMGRWQLETGPFEYNRMRLTMDGRIVWLTERQGCLLAYLMQNSGRAISYGELMQQVWEFEHRTMGEERSLVTTLCSLRKRIDPHKPYLLITTVHKHLLFHPELCQ